MTPWRSLVSCNQCAPCDGPATDGITRLTILTHDQVWHAAVQLKLEAPLTQQVWALAMNLKSVTARLMRGELHYALGRFRTIRASYSRLQRLKGAVRHAPEVESAPQPTLFPNTDIARAVETMREEAVFLGLRLPLHIIADIYAFGRSEPLHARYDPHGPTFHYADVVRGRATDGRPMPLGGIREPSRCPAVRAVVEDPVLRAIVRKYLGYEPSRVITILDWSFASDFTDEERRRTQRPKDWVIYRPSDHAPFAKMACDPSSDALRVNLKGYNLISFGWHEARLVAHPPKPSLDDSNIMLRTPIQAHNRLHMAGRDKNARRN
jgi:hypothetical protein